MEDQSNKNIEGLTQLDYAHFLYAGALKASGLNEIMVRGLVHNARKIASKNLDSEEMADLCGVEINKARILISEAISLNIEQERHSSFIDGQTAGIVLGENQGYSDGFKRGKREGYREGHAKGYEKGKAIFSRAGLTKVFAGMLLGASGGVGYTTYSKAEQSHSEVIQPNAGGIDHKNETITGRPDQPNAANRPKNSKQGTKKVRPKTKQDPHKEGSHSLDLNQDSTTYDFEDDDVYTSD